MVTNARCSCFMSEGECHQQFFPICVVIVEGGIVEQQC